MNTTRKLLRIILIVIFTGLAIFLIVLALMSYGSLRAFADSILPDHNFNSLKPWNAIIFKIIFGAGSLVFLGMVVLTLRRRLNVVGHFLTHLWTDARHWIGSIRIQKSDLGFAAGLAVFTFIGVIFRLQGANKPMAHDEAYTIVSFSRSLFTALTDYSKPNNHILHSVLVHFSVQIFGNSPWAARLPAFLAGVLLIPASYWLAARFYDCWTALGTAFLVAWYPPLVAYANDARGYTMLALFTVIILALGHLVRREKNLFLWALISLFSALGLYTVPIMLLPFGVLYVWLFLENSVADPGPYKSRREFLLYWLASGFGAALVTILLYTPILIFNQAANLFANDMLTPVPWRDLLVTLSARFSDVSREWSRNIPTPVLILGGVGFILGLIFKRKLSTVLFPVQVAALVWFAIYILIRRPNAEARFWVFLMPLALLWAAAGFFALLQRARLNTYHWINLALPIVAVLMIYGLWQSIRLMPRLPGIWASRGREEMTVLFIHDYLQPGDIVVISSPDDAAVWYYSEIHGVPSQCYNTEDSAFAHALVIVDSQWRQTLSTVLADRGPDPGLLKTDSASLLGNVGTIQIFEIPHD